MAQYIEDWSGHSLGSGVPAGWTQRWVTSGWSYTVSEDEGAPGGKSLRIRRSASGSARSLLSFGEIDSDPDRAEIDIIALVRAREIPTATASLAGLGGRCRGTAGSEVGTIAVVGTTGGLSGTDIRRINYGPAVIEYSSGGLWGSEERVWLRLTISGADAVARIYPYDDPMGEPRDSVSLAPVGADAGTLRTGIFTFALSADVDILWFGAGTGEDEAPLPVGWGGDEEPQGTVTITNVTPGHDSALTVYGYDDTDATGFQWRVDEGDPATIGSSPATITGLEPETDYDSPGLQIRAVNTHGEGAWSAAFPFSTTAEPEEMVLVTDFDGSNASASLSSITNPESQSPIVWVDARPGTTGGTGGSGWRTLPVAVEKAEGRTPIFRLNRATMDRPAIVPALSYLPSYTTDFESWVQADSRTLVGGPGGHIEFQFSGPLPAGRVYVSPHPFVGNWAADALATELMTEYSGVATPAASADAGGVYNTTPAEMDDISRPVGGNDQYAIKLAWPGPTTDGGPKRKLVMLAGIHAAGEQTSWFSFLAAVRWMLDDESEQADDFRSNWDVWLYFNITPNGLKGGHRRHNFRVATDPNRDFINKTLQEIQALTAAAESDVGTCDVMLSWHAHNGETSSVLIPGSDYSENAETPIFIGILEDTLGVTHHPYSSDLTDVDFRWGFDTLGATLSFAAEVRQRGDTSVETYQSVGQGWIKSVQVADAQGLFYQTGSEGGSSAEVTVTVQGAGVAQEHAAGGTTASVAVNAAGQGVAAEHSMGSSTAQIVISATGAGQASGSEQGGSSASVTVSATGAGAAAEVAQGGSTAQVSVSAQGAGIPGTGQSGGSTSNVIVLATGQGIAREHAAGGSSAGIKVAASGAGESSEGQVSEGGSTAQIIVFPTGSGAAVERAEGGSSAQVWVRALGTEDLSFNGPAILLEIRGEGRVAASGG